MNLLAARVRLLHARAFHSPFVALSASSRLATTTPAHPPAPVYEKQHDDSPEPHLSSSGTRTYVVSEPDPSNTPYQVPSGAYPASASYVNYRSTPNSEPLHGTPGSSRHPRTAGESAAAQNTEASGNSNPGKL